MSKDLVKLNIPGQSIEGETEYSEKGIFCNGKRVKPWLIVRIMKIRRGSLIICGSHFLNSFGEYRCCFRDDSKNRYKLKDTQSVLRTFEEFDGLTLIEQFFEVEIPLEGISHLEFLVSPKGEDPADDLPDRMTVVITYGRHGKLVSNVPGAYYAHGGYVLTKKRKRILVARCGQEEILKAELDHCAELRNAGVNEKLVSLRLEAVKRRALKKQEIWIVCDRDNAARDNGEALFKFLVKNEKAAKVYFAIDENCEDYSRMQQYGDVLKMGSDEYYLAYLMADKVISSQSGDWVTNPFGEDGKYMRSLYDFDFIFLQHGIILNDLSNWFVYYLLDISLFVTSAEREYEAVSHYGYCCNEKTVKLTGLPRFDYLEDQREKKIVFMPTWRKDISGDVIPGTSHREYSEAFKESEYFRFYNSLINSPELIGVMKRHGYTGELYVHPAFTVQARDFEGNDTIKVVESIADYSKVFRENSLMVTDYSSVAFDFAYLKKPMVYTIFDSDTFFENHHCGQGYFDYVRDGFGPVCEDLDTSIKAIIGYIESGCTMEKEYQSRVDDFFRYTDKNNCRRVYEYIKEL